MRMKRRHESALWRPLPRTLLCVVAALATCLVLSLAAKPAEAYPWMIQHGYTSCAGCHADPSGGELLTLYGHAISYEALSTQWGGKKETAAREERRVVRATARAAGAKAARPPDEAAASDDEEEEEEAATEGASGTEAASGDAAANAEAASSDDVSPEGAGESGEGADAETTSSDSAAPAEGAPEPSPFEGMSSLTGPFFGLLSPNESFLLGGSMRLASIFKPDADSEKTKFFPMQLDIYGQVRIATRLRLAASVGLAKVPAGSPHARPAQITRNQGDGYNAISRTHWVGYDFGEGAHLIRAGRLNLPFGTRLSEHVLWVRENTRTDRESDQQHGVALYMGFENWRFELMGIAGNFQINGDEFRERGYSGYVEYVVDPKAVVGLSSLVTRAKSDRVLPDGKPVVRQAHGLFVRAAPAESVALLAEVDMLLRSRTSTGYVGFVQLDFEVFQGFHVMGTGELRDQGLHESPPAGPLVNLIAPTNGQGRPEGGGWLSFQWFFLPHFDFRVDAIIRSEKQILSQLHVYL